MYLQKYSISENLASFGPPSQCFVSFSYPASIAVCQHCRLTPCIGYWLTSFPKIQPETEEPKSGAHFYGWFSQYWTSRGREFIAQYLDSGPVNDTLVSSDPKYIYLFILMAINELKRASQPAQ